MAMDRLRGGIYEHTVNTTHLHRPSPGKRAITKQTRLFILKKVSHFKEKLST